MFSAITRALSILHDKKVLHLDLKESNILINWNKDNMNRVEYANLPIEFKISDFGIA